MVKPTAMQQYHLGLLRLARTFGLVFAVGSVLIAASNVPGLVRAGDVGEWTITLLGAAGFLAVGILLFIVSGRALNQYRAYVAAETAVNICQICGRQLDVENDPLSLDCGGDCWGCVGACEMDWEPSAARVGQEIQDGLRNADGSPKKPVIPGEAKRRPGTDA